MRLEYLHRRHSSALSANILLRPAWKLGLGLLIVAAMTTSRSAGSTVVHTAPRNLATNVLPTSVPCGPIQVDPTTNTAVWTATSSPYGTGSPYILPWNDPKNTDPSRQPNCVISDAHGNPIAADDLHLAPGTKLVIDGSQGPVKIFSHGAGISVDGGEIRTINTSATNFISFDAELDVASWDGIAIHASDAAHRGDGSFSYVTIQHALTAVSIDSGATSSPDNPNYGLTVANSGIGPSYFDGIDATNTPIAVTGLGDGQYGTVNNIGSQGINVIYEKSPPAPAPPPLVINETALKVTGITFGSSVPFGETGCPPEPQPCPNRVVGSIGNNAVVANLPDPTQPNAISKPVVIDQNNFFRAGSFGVDLSNVNHPQVTNNDFVCNGSGSPTPVTTCTANGTLQKFSAIDLENMTGDLLPDPAPQPRPAQCPLPPTPPPLPPPLCPPLAIAGVSNNVGQENGLDATVVSGRISSDVIWKTPTNDPNGPSVDPPHDLGYMVANIAGTGGIEIVGKKLNVGDGDVVKVQGGGITLTGGSLDASSSGIKTFTSMRDNGVGIQACPSVFDQTCLATLPSNEWTGIDLSRATAQINNANILFTTKGVYATGPTPALSGSTYSLIINQSRIGPSFSDSIATAGVSASISNTHFCRIDSVALKPDGSQNPTYGSCTAAGPGDHGINADFSGSGGTLTVRNNTFLGSTNEGIVGTGLVSATSTGPVSATVDIESNTIDQAGAYGLRLVGAQNPSLKGNIVTHSGTGATTYPAMYLPGLSNANFVKVTSAPSSLPSCTCIAWNTGFGNGLDAIAFDGSTGSALDWISPANGNASAPLGYLLSDGLQVGSDLTLNANDLVEVAHGAITVSGTLSAPNALITSVKQGDRGLPAGFAAVKFPTCGSIFAPLASKNCPVPMPGDWTGLILNVQKSNTFNGTSIRYAATAIRIDQPPPPALPTPTVTQSISQTTIQEFADTGIHSNAYLVIGGGQITNTNPSTGNGVWFDHGANINGTQISRTGQEAILGTNLHTSLTPVSITGTSLDSAGTYGIRLAPAGPSLDGTRVTLINNMVTNSGRGGSPFPAIELNAISNAVFLLPTDGPFGGPSIQNNTGSGNGLDATAFHGSLAQPLTWITAYKNAPGQALGYLLDGGLDLQGKGLTVRAGDIVKVGGGGSINLNGGRLQADDTSISSQKIFTTLSDNAVGVAACPSALLPPGCGVATGYWGGIVLPMPTGGPRSDAALVNAAVRYATTGISITSGATSTVGSSTYGLVVSHSAIGPTQLDGIDATLTPISVTNSTISNSVHGISADLTNASTSIPLLLSGNRFVSTSAEAILGQALAGQPVWVTNNQIQQAGTFGIRLLNADELVLRNNNISSSGNGPGGPYPAIDLDPVSGDFASGIRGNVGSKNGIDAIAMRGTVQMDPTVTRTMSWVKPTNSAATHPLGYVLTGSLTLQNSDLMVNAGDVVKVLSGSITINQGSLTSGAGAVFTSFRDNTVAPSLCPSALLPQCAAPGAGDWRGVSINGLNPTASESVVTSTTLRYVDTALSLNVGPFSSPPAAGNFRAEILGSTITNASGDGINAVDTPLKVDGTTIGNPSAGQVNIGGRGIIAASFGPANCPASPGCERLHLTNNTISWTGKDGIVANGLTGEPTVVTGNDVEHAGTYGIRLLNADMLTLNDNTVNGSGGPATSFRYPAIALSAVKADFEVASGTGTVAGNHGAGNGLNVVALDGEASKKMTWLTTGITATTDHFGYVLSGGLIVDGDLTTNPGDHVKVLGGAIKVNGGLHATGTTFTSLLDNAVSIAVCDPTFDSVFAQKTGANCPPASNTDWNGINIDALNSTFNSSNLYYATDGLKISNAKLDVNRATLRGISGTAVASSGTQLLTVECSNIKGNGTGVAADYGTVAESDVYNNSVADLAGNANLQAANDWLGAAPKTGGATVTGALAAQRPVMTLTLSSDNPLSKPDAHGDIAVGVGNLTLTADSNRQMDETVLPTGQFALTTGATSIFSFNVTGLPNNGYSTDHRWMPNPYFVDDIASVAQAGINTATVTRARDCVPAEVGNADPSKDNPDSNLINPPATEQFSASLHHTVLTVSPAAGPYGGTALLAAHLTALGQPAANQTVSFKLNGTSAGTAATNASGDASMTASLVGINAGNYPAGVQASFGGDPDQFFTPSPSATGLPITAALTVNPAGTTTLLASSSNPSTYGTNVTWTATVNTVVSSGVNPKGEGTVTFNDGITVLCSNAALGAATNTATCTRNDLSAGLHSITATYNPVAVNPNFTTSTSSAVSQTINPATPAVATSPSAGGGLGTEISESVTVSDGPTPGGTATFRLFGPGDATCTGTNLVSGDSSFANVSLVNGKTTSPQFQATTAGDYHWIVDYSADANHNSVPGSCGDKTTITTDLATTTALASGPTDVTTSLTSVSLTATITATWTAQPNPTGGTVSFTAGASSITCGAGSTAGLALTAISNQVTCVTDYATVNGNKIVATYSGNTSGGTTYDGSTGSLLSSTTTLTSSSPSGIASGASVTLTATLDPTAAGGTVEFFDGSTPISGCTAQAVSAGAASCTTTSLTGAGTTHALTAIYSGSNSYETSEGTFNQPINP